MEIIVSLLMIALSFVCSRIEKTSYMQLLYELCICNHYIYKAIYIRVMRNCYIKQGKRMTLRHASAIEICEEEMI